MCKKTTISTNTPSNPLILIIDDEEAIVDTLKDALIDELYHAQVFHVTKDSDEQQILDLIGKTIPDLILLDIFMPNCNGLTILKQIKKEYPDQKVIIISGFGNIPIAIEALQNGAMDFIEKPLNLDEILHKIDFLKQETQSKDLQENVTQKPDQDPNIIGESHLFLELLHQANLLAPYTFPILIYGEHGVGKTSLANYINKKSDKNHKQLITIDCETLSKTGPNSFQVIHENTNDKTIYLKHICTLSPEDQKELLILLTQNREKYKRIITSSKKSLFSLVQQGNFNESLFFHLNTAPLEIPPLRKRPYDIPLLINHYLQLHNKTHAKQIVLTTQTIRQLRNHTWPGNITELKQVIERLVITSTDDYALITIQDAISVIGEQNIQLAEEQSIHLFESLKQATDAFTKQFLLYLLKKNRYDIKQVSHRLNLSSLQLKNKLQELKIDIQNQFS